MGEHVEHGVHPLGLLGVEIEAVAGGHRRFTLTSGEFVPGLCCSHVKSHSAQVIR
jgi:hypothetical protein